MTATLICIAPGLWPLWKSPTRRSLVLATANSAWAFFLFSFQVHEKTVLVPLFPTTLLSFDPAFNEDWINAINLVATFSLWPLLQKDGLAVQYTVVLSIWFWSMSARQTYLSLTNFSLLVVIAFHVLEHIVTIPGKPDLWTVLNVMACTPVFGCAYLWTLYELYAHTTLSLTGNYDATEQQARALTSSKS